MTNSDPVAAESVSNNPTAPRWVWRWGVVAGVLLLLLLGLFLALPTLLTRTAWGQRLWQRQLADRGIQFQVDRLSLGWFTPADLENLRLADDQGRWSFTAQEAASQRTLWQLIWSGGDWGEFRLIEPTLLLQAYQKLPPRDVPSARPEVAPAQRRLRLVITKARVLIQTEPDEQPSPFVQGADVSIAYDQSGTSREVTIEPGKPLDHAALTPEMCHLGLKYVVPVLAHVAWTQGAVSLELDQCRIPLHDPQSAEVAGRLTIHSVEAGLRESAVRDIVRQLATLGRPDSLPDALKLADNSVVSFRVHDGVVEHEDLAFGLPQVSPQLVIRTHGSVGMDGTLNLVAELPAAGNWLGDGPLARVLQQQGVRLPIRGTLQAPKVSLVEEGESWTDVLSKIGGPALEDPAVVTDLLQQLQELRQQRRERLEQQREEEEVEQSEDPARPGILQRLRQRRRP